MDRDRESNNNSMVIRRGLEDEDSSFSSMRSSLRARRDRLARKEARVQSEEKKEERSPAAASVDTPDAPTMRPHSLSNFTRNSVTRRSRLAHEYSEPQVNTNDDETALSLISSSKILSMDDSSIRSSRGLSAASQNSDTTCKDSQGSATPTDTLTALASPAGEGGSMLGMRKSLPTSTRSRRTRRDLAVDDMRNRTPSRELIHNDINGLFDDNNKIKSPLVNGSVTQDSELPSQSLTNGHDSQTTGISRRRSLLDDTDSGATTLAPPLNRNRSNSDFAPGVATGNDMDKPLVERSTSGSTTVSTGAAPPGETREERIARYKEMRKAALAARTTQYLESSADENTTPVSGYVPRYLRNRDGSGASVDRNRDEDSGSAYVPRWRRRNNNNDDNDIASSSNASSMTDLHMTRKDSTASSENSGDNAPSKLTYENLKLHDKLSSASAPYSSLSRLEEGPSIAPNTVNERSSSQAEDNDCNKYSHGKESTNEITPTNSPALATKASRRLSSTSAANDSENRSRRRSTHKDLEPEKVEDKPAQTITTNSRMESSKITTADGMRNGITTKDGEPSKVHSISPNGSEMDEPVARRGSVGLSDRLKKFQSSPASDTPTSKLAAKPGKLDPTRFIGRGATDEQPHQPLHRPEVKKLHGTFSPSNTSIHKTEDGETSKTDSNCDLTERVERRKHNSLLSKEPRPSSVINDEPLLDPQLAAMLDARKIKAGESPVPSRTSVAKQEASDVTSILKSRMRKREEVDGKKSTISVSARASFFAEEQQRVSETPPAQRPALDRHPSAKIPQVDSRDVEAKRAIGVKRAMLFKKRKRSATQPITIHEFVAAKTFKDKKCDKTQDELDIPDSHPFRGRLLSVPTTSREIHQVQIGAAPQKYIRPKEKKEEKKIEKGQKKIQMNRPISVKNVGSKVDCGKSVLSRTGVGRSSIRGTKELKTENTDNKRKTSTSSSQDNKAADLSNKVGRRSTSVRVASSSTGSVKAAADQASALIEAKKVATPSPKKTTGKVGEAIRAKATARVDSRRSSSYSQLNGSTKKLSVKVSEQGSSSTPESCPLSPASTISTTDRHFPEYHRKLSVSTVNSEDVPNYMRVTASSIQRERATPTSSSMDSGDELSHQPSKRRTGSLRELDSPSQPSYMKPTNSFAHRLEAKLDDLSIPIEVVEPKPKSKPVSLIEQETGEQPSFMKPTASSTKKLEKTDDDEKPKARRPISPTLPDGDLPSYMKATESYFKKVEHLFEEEMEETSKTSKRASLSRLLNDDELPSFMKPTKAFEAQVSIAVEEPVPEGKPRRKLPVVDPSSGEVPSYMKPTTAFVKRVEEDSNEPLDDKHKSISTAKLRSAPHSENGDIRSKREHGSNDALERRTSAVTNLSNGQVPSFMKPTKSFEIRDRHNEEAQAQQDDHTETERKVSTTKKPRVSITEGEFPSYMKATKSHEIRGHAIATGTVETNSLERALQGPMIDQIPEPTPAKPRKTSVGGFLRKKFGIGKGTSVDSVSSSSAAASKANKKSAAKNATNKPTATTSQGDDVPSYMKPTSNSSQRKISERRTTSSMHSLDKTACSETDEGEAMSHNENPPLINISQVSVDVDGEDVTVQMRPKKSLTRTKKEDINANNTPVRSTIASRLSSLQVNGEEGWKRRVGEKDHGSFRSGTIHDRLSKIEDNSKNWQKNKGLENDAKQFTVEGKMAKKGDIKIAPSPLMPRKDKPIGAAKRANSLRLRRDEEKSPVKRAQSTLVTKRIEKSNTPKITETTVVQVPDQDDAAQFFAPTSTKENIDVSAEDFDHIFVDASNILSSITKIKPKRNRASNSPNPYKALQMRQDIKSEYTETKSDIADLEIRRLSKNKVAEKASRAALAGLATKEDIKRVSLKKTNRAQVMNPGGTSAAPFADLMLIQIKGRRHVEMRIVQPTAKSVNSGDCFLLVTKNKVFQWMGEFANLMERSKAADLAHYIMTKKDIGCTLAKNVDVIEESKRVGSASNEFWKLLGGNSSYCGAGPVEEDELYEDYMADTNLVYNAKGDNLSPIDEYSAQIPRYDMLDDEQVVVFDFGTEVYAWCGKLTSMDQRKSGLKLARMLFQSGYDYSECDINPMSPLTLPDKGGLPKKSAKRPDWAICGKVTAKMETILFKEKFFDWPESSRLIQAKEASNNVSPTPAEELKAYDAQLMLERPENPVTLVLENSNVGRGDHWVEHEDGLRKEYAIDTLGVRMWHVSASDYYELMEDSYGQLHSSDTYVVRWQYQIKQSGVRNLKGNLSKHQTQMGRERCAYFFWQGAQSSINEKGASALMTVELDEEHGPQIRVEQGLEPACFLSIFKGHMITHLGKRDDDEKKNSIKLYGLQHEHEKETSLHEVPCRVESLRSRGVFIHLNIKTEALHLWFGSQASQGMKENGRRIAKWIAENCPIEIGLSLESSIKISEVTEGHESMELFTALRSNDRNKYHCLLKGAPNQRDYVARMFHMTSVNLTFHVQEMYLPARNEQYSVFPFVQCQLYKQQQPTLFLLDFGTEVYLWHGWWPVGFKEEENVSTGSARSRYTEDRKLAMETTLNYCKARKGESPKTYCVYAGKEPLSFTNHFSVWEINEEASQANTLENRPSVLEDMNECFTRLSKSVYTFEELQQRPLPDGVNPNKLETYLSDEEFLDKLKMTKEEFSSLPSWKQANTRKESNLF